MFSFIDNEEIQKVLVGFLEAGKDPEHQNLPYQDRIKYETIVNCAMKLFMQQIRLRG